ncbi:hypothetical protein [Williamsia sp. 1135]|uniref:hypothetical protein n=1 Tax=Williamsia sp. 1135 TaxID=1889262 RepID=UPI0011808FA0|nr:hypothetical protein [Williamsia sp. 1135]
MDRVPHAIRAASGLVGLGGCGGRDFAVRVRWWERRSRRVQLVTQCRGDDGCKHRHPDVHQNDPAVSGPVVLGRADNQYAIGYGTERPELVSLNSLCGNTISDITWTSWGGETATGTGNVCAPPGDPTSGGPTQLTATDLGDCYGVQAYRRLILASGGSFDTCS